MLPSCALPNSNGGVECRHGLRRNDDVDKKRHNAFFLSQRGVPSTRRSHDLSGTYSTNYCRVEQRQLSLQYMSYISQRQ